MEEVLEIVWHGRGGQGAVTGARVLAEAVIAGGSYAQAFPEFGPERRGAPVRAFNRISRSFFGGYYGITTPGIVLVLDDALLEAVDVTEGLLPGGIIIINTLSLRTKLKVEGAQVFTVDASGIARECIGRPIPNAPMLGALVKVKPVVDLQTLVETFEYSLSAKMAPEMVKANIKAIQRGYEGVARA